MEDILDDIPQNEDNEIQNWRTYLGKEAVYYIPRWQKIQSGQIITFNFYAFIFGIFWMLYRKMYRTVLFIGVFIFLDIIIEEKIRINLNMTEDEFQPIAWIINILYSTFFALFSNWLFYIESQRRISEVKNSSIGDYKLALMRKGGTSIISIILGMLAYVAIILLALIIVDPSFFTTLL